MHYLHVIASLNPKGGGPAEGVRQLSDAAVRVGHTMEVVTLDGPDSGWGEDMACPVHRLGPTYLGNYRYAPRLRPWLVENAHRFSAVIINGLWQYHGYATHRVLRETATPYFVFTHGMLDPWFKRTYPLKHFKKLLYWPWAEYRVLRDARAVLFTCDEERRLARESFGLYRAKEVVVSYGTPGPRGDAAVQREAFLSLFPQLRGQRILLFLGRIHAKKGCDLLIKAYRDIAAKYPDLQLVMAGPYPEDLRALLGGLAGQLDGSRITWTGMLSGDAKWGALRSAEAFFLPSHQENFGIAVAEALACDLPVLISNKVNIWREIAADGAGLVADDSYEGAAQLLNTWLRLGPEERTAMANRAGRCFRLRYQIDAAAQTLLSTLQSEPALA
jgi:glycosyltransferase involved in cell wall biosynthesis